MWKNLEIHDTHLFWRLQLPIWCLIVTITSDCLPCSTCLPPPLVVSNGLLMQCGAQLQSAWISCLILTSSSWITCLNSCITSPTRYFLLPRISLLTVALMQRKGKFMQRTLVRDGYNGKIFRYSFRTLLDFASQALFIAHPSCPPREFLWSKHLCASHCVAYKKVTSNIQKYRVRLMQYNQTRQRSPRRSYGRLTAAIQNLFGQTESWISIMAYWMYITALVSSSAATCSHYLLLPDMNQLQQSVLNIHGNPVRLCLDSGYKLGCIGTGSIDIYEYISRKLELSV